MKWIYISLLLLSLSACNKKEETTFPSEGPISESVYASGTLKSLDQYQAFAPVSGIVDQLFVQEGDSVKIGDPILSISHVAQQLNQENAALAANFSAAFFFNVVAPSAGSFIASFTAASYATRLSTRAGIVFNVPSVPGKPCAFW